MVRSAAAGEAADPGGVPRQAGKAARLHPVAFTRGSLPTNSWEPQPCACAFVEMAVETRATRSYALDERVQNWAACIGSTVATQTSHARPSLDVA